MKIEMEGKEPLWCLFGIPICTTAIVLISAWVCVPKIPDINIKLTPEVKATLPKEGISVNMPPIPPANVEIREIVKEVTKVSPVTVTNQVPQAAPPQVHFDMPSDLSVTVKNMPNLPGFSPPPPAKAEAKPEPTKLVAKTDTNEDGTLLPPPKR